MTNRLAVLVSAAFIAVVGLVPSASAAALETFFFSNSTGWIYGPTTFSGDFTGTVEADGFIELSDLSAFHIAFASGFRVLNGQQDTFINIDDPSLTNLLLFSYDTTGGPGSLSFIWDDFLAGGVTVCSGRPSVLALACNPSGGNPRTTFADFSIDLYRAVFNTTSDLTTVALLPTVSASAPEPSTWVMFCLGFASLGFVGSWTSRKGRDRLTQTGQLTRSPEVTY